MTDTPYIRYVLSWYQRKTGKQEHDPGWQTRTYAREEGALAALEQKRRDLYAVNAYVEIRIRLSQP